MSKNLTEKQEAFLDALQDIILNEPEVSNYYKEAALRAGYEGYEKNYMRIAKALSDEISDITKSVLVSAGPQAAGTMVAIMQGKSSDGAARDKLSAASNILDRGVGIVKVDKQEVDVKGGVILLPPKRSEDDYEEADADI